MAPRTTGGLAGGMAHGGHIHRENYEIIDAKGPAPTSAFSRNPDFHLRSLGLMAHGGHTPRTALGGCIPEFIYLEGPLPSLVPSRGQASRPRNQRTMAHDELARGMASIGHILPGNHVVNHTEGPMPVSAPSHSLDLHLGSLDLMAYGRHTPRTTHWRCIS